ncbi:phosphotransferase [Desulfuromonas sp. DDH964]|uniref:phosphotransferase n=1 Tax=Desulfuromonas sp. DDH964 TaxID=1823759 RepID=UPI00078B276F|nr:phosphotransferase [Desulfuromonas sp. DDH964]AMV71642.1 phosphotransferase, PolIIIAc domain-containing [Desulfuromonas sp. DDH964]
MLLEMHCHSLEHSPCSHVSATELVRRCFAKGLQGMVLTDHHYLWPEAELRDLRRAARVPDHFLIFSAQETRTADFGDVLVYGAESTLPRDLPLAGLRQAAAQAALVWAHPYRKGEQPTDENLCHAAWNGIEIFNSNHSVRGNSRGLRDWHRLRFTAIAGTDTHGGSYAGLYPTLFDHPVTTITELTRELRAGRCRPFYKEIPRAGSKNRVTEVTFGAKGEDEIRERIIIRNLDTPFKWQSAERAHRIMEALASHGFSGGTYRVPAAIDADREDHTLIQEGLRGKLLFDRLKAAPAEDGRHYLQMAAKWLARLHNCRLVLTPPGEFLQREAQRLARYLDRFQSIGHPFSTRAKGLHDLLLHREEGLLRGSEDDLVQGHGDYHPKNIIIGQDLQEDRNTLFVAAVDFESSLCLPPAFDVGCFLAQFRNQFFTRPELLERYPDEIFLTTYRQERTSLPRDFDTQVELFRARTNLGIAAYLIKLGLGGSEDIYRVLVEAEQILTHASAAGFTRANKPQPAENKNGELSQRKSGE